MDYEKAYKDALKRAKKLYEQGTITESLSYVFPELAESEDERIREAQLDYWRSVGGKEWHGVPVQEAIAWLEKQGEQNFPILSNSAKTGKNWSEEDEKCIDNCCLLIGAADNCYEKPFKDDCIHYLQNLKQRMGV